MKNSRHFIVRILITSAVCFSLAAPLMAQQEVSPDRFETVAQSAQNPGAQKAGTQASFKKANKQAKTRNASHSPRQTAHMKNARAYEQIASK